jgi:hypothetical protein
MAARCLLENCGWTTSEPFHDIAGCFATWHVYEEHPDVWRTQFGSRLPEDPDPRIPEVYALLLVREVMLGERGHR